MNDNNPQGFWIGDSMATVTAVQGPPQSISDVRANYQIWNYPGSNEGPVSDYQSWISRRGNADPEAPSSVAFRLIDSHWQAYRIENYHGNLRLRLPELPAGRGTANPGSFWIGDTRLTVANVQGLPFSVTRHLNQETHWDKETWHYPGDDFNPSSVRFDENGHVDELSNSGGCLKVDPRIRGGLPLRWRVGDSTTLLVAIQGVPVAVEQKRVGTEKWYYADNSVNRTTYVEIKNGLIHDFSDSNGTLLLRQSVEEYHVLGKKLGLKWLGQAVPESILARTWWRCSRGHDWEISYSLLQSYRGCTYCARRGLL